ncbi:MAG: DNA-directed RNA polymerase subunit alpha [Blastocatellia bacterium]|nr:DNA-directed RNA polymerase subunit alpha [Blastocatellia bacterium]
MMWTTFQKPKRLICEADTLSDTYGRFYAHPFERGFGTTIGNALKRALLSSIEGTAVTAVKIEGLTNEFSQIPGVVEDATDILLALRSIPLKLNDADVKTFVLSKSGPGTLTSADIEVEGLEVLDKNIKIATMKQSVSLSFELRVKKARGYVAAEKNYDEDLDPGYIPLDSAHSPVRKVNYQVEAARLGQDTDYDRLSIEVWTNGSIKPESAVSFAARLIKEHMSIFINFEEGVEVQEQEPEERLSPFNENLDRSVEELELSVRSYNCLKNADIRTIRELVQKTEAEMLKTKNFGRKSLNEIKEILGAMGLHLGMKFDESGSIVKES